MAHFEVLSTTRRVVLPRLGRVVTGAALAVALGCGVAPIASVVAPSAAWADEVAQDGAADAAADSATKEGLPAEADAKAVIAPRGKWTFDGDDLKTNAISGSSLQMANATGVTAEASPVKSLGKMMHFGSKATDTDVKIPSAIKIGDDYSISMWIKADAGIENGAKTAILQMSTDNGRTLLYQLADGHYATFLAGSEHKFAKKNPGRGNWHHVTLVKNGTGSNGEGTKKIRLYIDGELAGEGSWTNNLDGGQTTPDLLVGEHKNASDMDRFQGDIDDLCIYGKALTAAEAKAHYDSYGDAKNDVALINAKVELQTLIVKAESMSQQGDGSEAYKELAAALEKAKLALGDDTDIDQINAAKSELEDAIGGVFALGIKVNVDPKTTIETIDEGIFGINHRYAFNGYGSYDSVNKKVKDDFAKLYDESNFGSIRYPGGTISNLFSWKETLDTISEDGTLQQRTNQIHGFYKEENGIAPNFGISEIGDFAVDHGSEIIYVYSLGRGDANDASDLIEFLNAKVGDNPNGGTDWAKVRAENGHKEPYNVRYFEIGNEMQQSYTEKEEGTASQSYWTKSVLSDPNNTQSSMKSAVDGYIDGGMVSRVKEYAVVKGNWNINKSKSTGEADQQFGMRYALLPRDVKAEGYSEWTAVEPNSVEVYVCDANGGNEVKWEKTNDLSKENATAQKYELDLKTGTITFGDNTNGKIPESGKQIKVSYKVERDGFIEISKSMRDTMAKINEQRARDGQTPGEIHVYSSFEDVSFMNGMNTRKQNGLYDGVAIHPYSFGPGNSYTGQNFYLQAMALGDNAVGKVRHLTEEMRRISDDKTKVPVISEYGIYNSKNPLVRSQMHALYIARQVMEYIKLGSPYIQKHCLVDWYSDGGDKLGPTQQAVIQAVKGPDGNIATGEGTFTFFKTPSALVFEMYNGKKAKDGQPAQPGFGEQILSTTTSEMPTLSNGVKMHDVLTSRDADGNYYVAVTNLDMENKRRFTFNVAGEDFTGRKMEVRSIVGDNYDTENSPDDPNKVTVQYGDPYVSTEANPHFELEPHSFTIVKIYAEQPLTQHTVTFTVDGEAWGEPQMVADGGLATAPADPAKDGYEFKHWALNGAPFDFKTPVTSDITLTAVFEKVDAPAPKPEDRTVTFVVDGEVYHTATVKDGELVAAPADPTKEGHVFKGWLLDGKPFDFKTPVTGDLKLEASFEKSPVAPETPDTDANDTDTDATPETPNKKPGTGGGLPQTGDPAVLVGALAAVGAGLAFGGRQLRRRK